MRIEAGTEAVGTLEKAAGELQALSHTTAGEMDAVARVFVGLAGHTETLLNLAAAIVGCVEKERVSSVLPLVQTLGEEARRFMGERLEATAGILETVAGEAQLLGQLSQVTRGQAAIAFETQALSVLTNIEVARLGAVGAGFQYLAHELTEFSKAVTADTQELGRHTDGRRAAIEATRRVLGAELPRRREELARIEGDLGEALAGVDASLTQLSGTPAQLRTCVEEIARQIAGVVAAVQAHDITRQQIDHVQEGLALIAAKMGGEGNPPQAGAPAAALAHAGLTIQIYQLRTLQETVAHWASQIRTCLGGILRISASEVVGMGPAVLAQERELSAQLALIERLEGESQDCSARIQGSLGGLASLLQLVSAHWQRAKSIRDRLQLLTFNAIIEASRLGTQAAAILAIAQSIKGVSGEWSQVTDQTGQARQEVLRLVKQGNELREAFSEVSHQRLRAAQGQTRAGLDNLRSAATFATGQAQEMQAATGQMQAKTTAVGNSVDLLDACFGRLDAVRSAIEGVRRQWEIQHPEAQEGSNAAEVERLFSASYTTELERQVLRAALHGTDLPAAQPTLAGNSVELF